MSDVDRDGFVSTPIPEKDVHVCFVNVEGVWRVLMTGKTASLSKELDFESLYDFKEAFDEVWEDATRPLMDDAGISKVMRVVATYLPAGAYYDVRAELEALRKEAPSDF